MREQGSCAIQKAVLLLVALVMQYLGWLAPLFVATQHFYSKPKAIQTFAHERLDMASPPLRLTLRLPSQHPCICMPLNESTS